MNMKWRAYPVDEKGRVCRVDGAVEIEDRTFQQLQPAVAHRVVREFPNLRDYHIYIEEEKNESA